MMKDINVKNVVKVLLPMIIALISIFGASKYATSAEFHAKTIESLDEKKTTVMELTAASTATSAAITLIPGDTATPIADKLADLSSYFLIVICAIYLEKYLLTITGYATFVILIPAACILYVTYVLSKNDTCKHLSKKLAAFGIAIVLVIPTSVQVSNMIETTYQASIDNTLDTAKQTAATIDEDVVAEKEEEGLVAGIVSKVKDGVSAATTEVENVLNNFIEALAVMLVTSCVIPIAVMMFFIWLIKSVLAVNIEVPKRIE